MTAPRLIMWKNHCIVENVEENYHINLAANESAQFVYVHQCLMTWCTVLGQMQDFAGKITTAAVTWAEA